MGLPKSLDHTKKKQNLEIEGKDSLRVGWGVNRKREDLRHRVLCDSSQLSLLRGDDMDNDRDGNGTAWNLRAKRQIPAVKEERPGYTLKTNRTPNRHRQKLIR